MDTLIALNQLTEKDLARAKDREAKVRKLLEKPPQPMMLAIRLIDDTLVNIKTNHLYPGPTKKVVLVDSDKTGDKYTPKWYRTYTKGRVLLPIKGIEVGIKSISIFYHEEGGPPPQPGSVNMESDTLEVIQVGRGRLVLLDAQYSGEYLLNHHDEIMAQFGS